MANTNETYAARIQRKLMKKQYLVEVATGRRKADLVLKNASYVNVFSNELCHGDIAVAKGQIVGMGDYAGEVEYDVSGKIVCPGFIDAHTHFDLDVCSTTTVDDFFSGSRAALRGGTTTVVDFACPNKGESLHHGLELWHRKADGRTCRADVFERCRRRKSRCGAKFSDELPPVECVKKVDIARPAVQNGNRQFAVN